MMMKIRMRHLRRLLMTEAAVGADDAREVIKRFNKGMSALGVSPEGVDSMQVLGIGTHGTALEMPDGRVLKVTNDTKEAESAAMLMGQNFKNIVNFYDVWEFGDTGLFGILQEKVVPLEGGEAKAFNDALISTGLPLWIRKSPDNWDQVKVMTKQHIVRSVKKKFPDNHNSPEAQQFAHEINDKWSALINTYGIKNMFDTLNEIGIDFHDYHAGNLMKREDGTLVLIDLGISAIRGGGAQMRSMSESRRCISIQRMV